MSRRETSAASGSRGSTVILDSSAMDSLTSLLTISRESSDSPADRYTGEPSRARALPADALTVGRPRGGRIRGGTARVLPPLPVSGRPG
ncbi:hypothetical protein GCM10027091_40430 [Streptomyces daliensis]